MLRTAAVEEGAPAVAEYMKLWTPSASSVPTPPTDPAAAVVAAAPVDLRFLFGSSRR
eukprot:COSAG06_NODE_1066_length_10841_cov_14.808806_8_plen_57_part_00